MEKVTDIIGLYLNSPEHALLPCADEKSQTQALDRTQRPLPLKRGRAKNATYDYRRHGTTTLFAAIELLSRTVVSHCMPRHRHQEWLKFLRQIDDEMRPQYDLHLIVDNYATHKHPAVQKWLVKHPRFHMHFTPTRGRGRDGTFYVIAGRANHLGSGRWQNITTGNTRLIGIDAENTGNPDDWPWPDVQVDAYRRGVAAILKRIGRGAQSCAGNKQYALPAGRKDDPNFDMGLFRKDVADILARRGSCSGSHPGLEPSGRGRPTLRRGDTGAEVAEFRRS